MKTVCLLIAAIGFAGMAAADTPPLAPMAFWAGHCFKGTLADGKQTDEHCFTWVFEGSVLRDHHVARNPGKPDYVGETVYFWDPEANKIAFLYYENAGGISRGTAEPVADGMVFPPARYAASGDSMTYRVRWTKQGSDAYEAFSEAQNGDKWVTMFRMTLREDHAGGR